ncbi:hypothetical protein [Streptomyces apricus]|uniref:Uncharacterized protein n=1 Tax=Streptomyces apricus TaxID=1828112 RepID=A0A5B0AYQ5_9ACTN|nr:hypothetical protein [Streptomyces apricus]KAA0935150.1 hypothetical protein FGF04_13585 [Streptomyces apricus]
MSPLDPPVPHPPSARAAGALLLCRAEPEAVEAVARLLRERMLLVPAGREWSVLVPEGKPWSQGGEPVDRVLAGWAGALAVGAPWPVLALWWDADHSGCTLATGFRRAVGYEWLANGTPVGVGEAMHTLAGRLGLDPVLDVQALDRLTQDDPETGARARLRGLLAVLARVGVALPAGLDPGDPADRLSEAARALPGVRTVEWPGRGHAVRAEIDAVGHSRVGAWLPGAGTPQARGLALAQVAAGLPLLVRGLRRRGDGWSAAGLLLVAHGALGLAYERVKARG